MTDARAGEPTGSELTQYLHRWRAGDSEARDTLLTHVYAQLRAMAHARLRAERSDHTLDSTALVHEAFLRLGDAGGTDWQDRAHFFAVASTAMRRVLVDYAKQRQADKRGHGLTRVDFDTANLRDAATVANSEPETLLALEDAMRKLERVHARQAKALELRYFAGLNLEEISSVLETSAPTVLRDLRFAQAWLANELG